MKNIDWELKLMLIAVFSGIFVCFISAKGCSENRLKEIDKRSQDRRKCYELCKPNGVKEFTPYRCICR